VSQYHKTIFIQNSLGKISTRTYWRETDQASETPRPLDYNVQIFFWGGDDPKREHFRKYLSGFIDETPYYVWWPNLVKIGRCEVTERSYGLGLPHIKTRAPRDSSQPPFCSKWANRAQNTHNFISPRRVAETEEKEE